MNHDWSIAITGCQRDFSLVNLEPVFEVQGMAVNQNGGDLIGLARRDCPTCGCEKLLSLGTLPVAFHFCASNFDFPVNHGELIECQNCSLRFRNPCLPGAVLSKLYATQPASLSWDFGTNHRNDFIKIEAQIKSIGLGAGSLNIMDVGCYKGGLLKQIQRSLHSQTRLRLSGIEPSAAAAACARNDGIDIVASSLHDAPQLPIYDIITLVDVFEHLVDSGEAVRRCLQMLRPGGHLIVSTGAFDSPIFSRYKNHYSYAALPEHVAFISARHVDWLADNLRCDVLKYELINHSTLKPSSMGRIRISIRNLLFHMLSPLPTSYFLSRSKIVRFLRRQRSRGITDSSGAPDHAIVILRKQQ